MKKVFIVGVLISTLLTVEAQTPTKTTTSSTQIWTQYFMSTRLSKSWSTYFDGGIRFTEFFQHTSQILLRPGVIYHANSNIALSAGVVYFRHYPSITGNEEVRQEKRLWQQVTLTGKLGKTNVNHRFRLEERWQQKMSAGIATDEWNYNFRMRYQINLTYPLKGDKLAKGIPFIIAYDEIMLNFGKEIIYNSFDQNRIYLGMGYSISDQLAVTMGYQWGFGQKKSGYQYESISCARFTIIHQLDLRKSNDN